MYFIWISHFSHFNVTAKRQNNQTRVETFRLETWFVRHCGKPWTSTWIWRAWTCHSFPCLFHLVKTSRQTRQRGGGTRSTVFHETMAQRRDRIEIHKKIPGAYCSTRNFDPIYFGLKFQFGFWFFATSPEFLWFTSISLFYLSFLVFDLGRSLFFADNNEISSHK